MAMVLRRRAQPRREIAEFRRGEIRHVYLVETQEAEFAQVFQDRDNAGMRRVESAADLRRICRFLRLPEEFNDAKGARDRSAD